MPVVIVSVIALAFSCMFGPCHSMRQVAYQYPKRCQYFDIANAPENKAYCDNWFATHKDVGL